MTPVYLIMRGAAVVCARPTAAEAMAAAQGPNLRVEVRRTIRPWWRRPADWSVL